MRGWFGGIFGALLTELGLRCLRALLVLDGALPQLSSTCSALAYVVQPLSRSHARVKCFLSDEKFTRPLTTREFPNTMLNMLSAPAGRTAHASLSSGWSPPIGRPRATVWGWLGPTSQVRSGAQKLPLQFTHCKFKYRTKKLISTLVKESYL